MGEKRLIHAVAGSGKTRTIIEAIDPANRNLIITYTNNNQEVLKSRLIDKFGLIPESTHVFGVFEFLYRFCLIPYLGERLEGINFNYSKTNRFDRNSIDGSRRVIHNQLSQALLNGKLRYAAHVIDFDSSYLARIDKFFDNVFIDECQDFESYDFDWMLSLSNLRANVYLLGDFYQKTFSTSSSGNKGRGIHSDLNKWLTEIRKANFDIDTTSLSESRRCPVRICEFVKENLGIEIFFSTESAEEGRVIFIDPSNQVDEIMEDDSIMKLFFQNSSKYNCVSQNWGESKGAEFEKVCVVLNKATYEHYKKGTLKELAPSTKSKLYVACTRTIKILYFISEQKIKHFIKDG